MLTAYVYKRTSVQPYFHLEGKKTPFLISFNFHPSVDVVTTVWAGCAGYTVTHTVVWAGCAGYTVAE